MTDKKLVSISSEYPGFDDWSILCGYRGSIAHGMYVPKSDPNSIDDKDLMSICVPPLSYYYGLKEYGSKGTKEIQQGSWDIVVYEARKFIRMLVGGNPNVLALLWLEPNFYRKKTAAGQLILTHRNLFVGRHVYRSFVGYAHGQLKRMTSHNKQGHMGAKRRELIKKYGYDTKNAAHLIRLLRMGTEFLKDGQLYVLRKHDAKQLLDIKGGKWTLGRVQAEADRWFGYAEQAYLASTLPENVDRVTINRLCVDVIKTAMMEIHDEKDK